MAKNDSKDTWQSILGYLAKYLRILFLMDFGLETNTNNI